MVVTITIITTAEKTDSSMIGRPARLRPNPIFAKISPTSPRGIIPIPMDRRSSGRPIAPRAHACPEHHAGDQFSKDGWLSHSDRQMAADLRHGQNDGQGQNDRRDGISVASTLVSLCDE